MFEEFKYKFAKKYVTENSSNVLEVGIGNDSPLRFKKIFPNVNYYGVDKNLDYNLSKESIKAIDKFYKIDLEKENLNEIPNDFFDYVIIAHVIEHLDNGEEIIKQLSTKIKTGGALYIEYPRKISAKFPSMKGTLNFYDDPTHKRFYEIEELKKILISRDFKIIKSGTKRDFVRILGIPFMIFKSYLTLHYLRGSVFWDLLGFAEFILAEKK